MEMTVIWKKNGLRLVVLDLFEGKLGVPGQFSTTDRRGH